MKVIFNKIIPFKGFSAVNLFGVLFVRRNIKITDQLLTHEKIHTAQMREMLYFFFYLWYFVEWIVRLVVNPKTAYRSISLEQEAYNNDKNNTYLSSRRAYEWWTFIK